MSLAGTWNIVVDQGKTLSRSCRYGYRAAGVFTPFDNTGMAARMQVRRNYTTAVIDLDLTSGAGELILGGANGEIAILVDAVSMETLSGAYVYDLELVDSSVTPEVVYGVSRGTFTVRPEVTK